jgi:hypothetical protein
MHLMVMAFAPPVVSLAQKWACKHLHIGDDPYQHLHDEIANRVADPDDPINKDNAQDALYQLVNSQDGDQ